MFLLSQTAKTLSHFGVWNASIQNNPVFDFFSNVIDFFFGVELHVYRHIDLDPSANQTVQILILGIAIGLILASIMMCYTRTRLGRFVHILVKNECLSPESAKTLRELDEFRNASVRRALTRGTTLGKYVRCVEAADFDAELAKKEKEEALKHAPWWKKTVTAIRKFFAGDDVSFRPDFTSAHFYLPEEIKDRAEIRFEKRGSGWLTVVIISVVSLVFASVLCKLLPDLLQLMDNIISMMEPSA